MGAAWKHRVLKVGERVGKRTVLAFVPAEDGRKRILVKCDCGDERVVLHKDLVRGIGESCRACAMTQHGLCDTPEYHVCYMAVERCDAPRSDHDRKHYAGRGIRAIWPGETIAQKALAMLQWVLENIGSRPSPKHQIDRINNDGNYEPGNLRWATMPENQRHKRNNSTYTYQGETLCVSEWAELYGINYYTLWSRVKRDGWNIERALTTPVRGAHGTQS